MPSQDEEWRPVVGFEGLYEVSDLGRVRRVGRAATTGKGHGGGARIGLVLKLRRQRSGHLLAQLWRDGHPCPRLIHVLVAAAFIGPCPQGKEVNHIDGVPPNNRPDNLEYVTRSENMLHAYRIGLRVASVLHGEQHANARLTVEQVREMRRLYRPGVYGTPRLARQFGVNTATAYRIVMGKAWKDALES